MSRNKQILEKWKKEIEQYKKLTLNESQELYNKTRSCKNEKIKKQLRNELITGTLYVIYEAINSNELIYMNSSYYDMNDIINAMIEIWIRKIDSGELLKVDNFSKIFSHDFYNKISENFGIKNDLDYKEYLCDKKLFIELIVDYLRKKEKNENFDYYELIQYMREKPIYQQLLKTVDRNYYDLKKYENSDININEQLKNRLKEHIDESNVSFFELFDAIIKSFELNGENIDIVKSTLYKIRNLAVHNGLEYNRKSIDELIVSAEYIETIIDKKQLRQTLIDLINNIKSVKAIDKKIVFERFGFNDGEFKTLDKTGKKYGKTREYARQAEARVLRKLRASKRAEQIKDYI